MYRKKFEDKIQNLLNLLTEADPNVDQPIENPQQKPVEPTRQANDPNKQLAVQKPELTIPEESFQYYSTQVMYYKKPPSDSSEWPREQKQKKWLLPLMDGRIMRNLAKSVGSSFELDKSSSQGAARYRPYQFRVILRGTLTPSVSFSVNEKDGILRLKMVKLEVTTPHAGSINLASGSTLFSGKKINIKIDKNVPEIEVTDNNDPSSEENIKLMKVIEGAAISQFEAKKTLATKFAKWAIKNHTIQDNKDAIDIVLRYFKDFASGAYDANESYDFEKYLDKMLFELREKGASKYSRSKMGKEVKKDSKAAEVENAINKNIGQIIREDGLTCSARNRVFEGTILEFFATHEAGFVIDSITSEGSDIDKKYLVNGKLKLSGEVWFDARVGETDRRFDTWTFRVHDRPDRYFMKKRYGVILPKLTGNKNNKLDLKQPEVIK